MPYWPPANETLLDMISSAGLQVLFSTKDTYTMNNSEAFVKAQVARWKDHEAVLGWYVASTPNGFVWFRDVSSTNTNTDRWVTNVRCGLS